MNDSKPTRITHREHHPTILHLTTCGPHISSWRCTTIGGTPATFSLLGIKGKADIINIVHTDIVHVIIVLLSSSVARVSYLHCVLMFFLIHSSHPVACCYQYVFVGFDLFVSLCVW
jgi:hypothetical protein